MVYLETCDRVERWCLIVEDPKDSSKSRLFKCIGREARKNNDGSRKIRGNKKTGAWYFKAFRYNGVIESTESINKPISRAMSGFPSDSFQQIPLSELEKLKEWTD